MFVAISESIKINPVRDEMFTPFYSLLSVNARIIPTTIKKAPIQKNPYGTSAKKKYASTEAKIGSPNIARFTRYTSV